MLNRSINLRISVMVALLLGLVMTQDASPKSTETEATRLLKQRSAEFKREVIRVTDGVYTAVGYGVSTVSMIVGDDGLIIVDTGIDTTSAEQVLSDFRKISEKPIVAIILTHSHGDHIGGLPVFTREGDPQVWARENFGAETDALNSVGLTIQYARGARQGGFKLPPEKRINNGVAQAYWPKRGGAVFGSKTGVKPTRLVEGPRQRIKIAGVDLDLVATEGETYDHLYVWFPARRVLFSGDNYYKSWPNLYPIRGAPYRDILSWADAVDMMLKEEPQSLVPGHTRPIVGKEKVAEALTDYRDAIRFVFNKTIEGMNKGLTPDELVDYVQPPERFQGKDNLRPYYGNPEWAVRAIFTAYLGWFDGNPTTLFSLPVKEEAERMASLAGGKDKLEAAAFQSLENKDYQWAAQLCDHLIALDPSAAEPKLMKATALEGLAENLLTATGRNYYLTCAQELRKEAGLGSRGEIRAKTLDRSEANKAAALDFFQLVMGDRDYEAARKYVGEYIQHDPRIGDGFDALVEALETNPLWSNRPKSTVAFKNVAADGDLVYFQTHREIEAKDDGSPARRIVVHVFRFNDAGKIDEHWTIAHSVKLKDSVSKHPLF